MRSIWFPVSTYLRPLTLYVVQYRYIIKCMIELKSSSLHLSSVFFIYLILSHFTYQQQHILLSSTNFVVPMSGKLVVANVGDSRAVIAQRNANGNPYFSVSHTDNNHTPTFLSLVSLIP